MKKGFITILAVMALMLAMVVPVMADTTQDVTVTATPSYMGIANAPSTYSFGVVAASSTTSTPSNHFTITNTSSIATNIAISVTTATWSGGVGWTHSDTATAAADTAGLKAGTADTNGIIVKNASPNNLVASLAANTDYSWNMQLVAPTSFTDGVQKSITVRLTATAA
jgi:hypothetical protein